MGNQCCASEENKEYEHISGQMKVKIPSPNPETDLESQALGSTLNSKLNAERLNTDIDDTENEGKYYGDCYE